MRKTITLLIALLALTVSSWAQTQIGPINGFYYEIDGSGNAKLIKDPTAENDWQSYSSSVANGVVVIPATVTYNDTDYPVKAIGEYAFQNCSSMTAVVIEEGVETLDRYAFFSCNSLTTASLPSTITSIGDNIFSYSENFNTLICKATEPPTLDYSPFDHVTAVAHIYVPSTSVNDYKAAEEWLNHESIIEAIPTSVTWNAENGLDDIRIVEYTNTSWGGSKNDGTKSAAIDGVAAVISATADGAYATVYTSDGSTNISLEKGGTLTFTSFFDKFTSIVINTNSDSYYTGQGGWSWNDRAHSYTWSGNTASASVVLSDIYLSNITSIVFTFEDNTPDPATVSTIVWDDADLATVNVEICSPVCSQTIKDIKVTNNADYSAGEYCHFNTSNGQHNNDDWADFSMSNGGSLTFSTTLGNFTRIVITCDVWGEDNMDTSTGWAWYSNTKKLIWSGTAASSVVLAADASGNSFTSGPIVSIEFTIESAPAAAEPESDADVVWNATDLESVGILNNGGTTIKNITATAVTPSNNDYCHFMNDEGNVNINISGNSTITFAVSEGSEDLAQIIIHGVVNPSYTNLGEWSGWTYDDSKLTWEGEHASSVVLSNVYVAHITYIEFNYYDPRERPELKFYNNLTEATIIKDIHGWLFEPGHDYNPSTSYLVYVRNGSFTYQGQQYENWVEPSGLGLTMTYSVPNNDVITLTNTEGDVFSFDVVNYGDVVVTAHTDGNEVYRPASITFTIHVIEGKGPNREGVLAFVGGTNDKELVPEGYKFELETGQEMAELELREKNHPQYSLAPYTAVWGSEKHHLAYFQGDKFLRALTAGDDELVVRYSRYNDGDENGNWLYIRVPVYVKPTEIALTSSVDFTSNPSSNGAIANNADYDEATHQVQIGEVLSDALVQAALDCYAFGHPGWNDNLKNTISFELPQGTGSLKVNGTVQEGCVLKVRIRSEADAHSFTPAQVAAGEAVVEYDVPYQTAVVIYINNVGGSGSAPKRAPAAKKDAPLAALSGIDMSPVYAITSKPDPDNSSVYYSTHFNETQKYQLPAGTEAYAATISGSDMILNKVADGGQVIPANTAVILRSTSASVVLTPTDAAAVTVSVPNQLLGTDSEKAAPANCYVLSGKSADNSVTGVGFYQFSGTLAAHKAYIINNNPSLAPSHRMRFVFNEENQATGVDHVSSDQVPSTKVIENGQLVIIKNGVRYNAQGQVVK